MGMVKKWVSKYGTPLKVSDSDSLTIICSYLLPRFWNNTHPDKQTKEALEPLKRFVVEV